MKAVSVEFDAKIQKAPNMDTFFIPLKIDVEKIFSKKRFKAKIWYDKVLYRGSVARYNGEYNLLINKSIREKLGKKPGELVHIKIAEDNDERSVEIPQAMLEFFRKEKALKSAFDNLAFTHQKEYAEWIRSAKRPETIETRLQKFKVMLASKMKK
jgi:hypothetical protein